MWWKNIENWGAKWRANTIQKIISQAGNEGDGRYNNKNSHTWQWGWQNKITRDLQKTFLSNMCAVDGEKSSFFFFPLGTPVHTIQLKVQTSSFNRTFREWNRWKPKEACTGTDWNDGRVSYPLKFLHFRSHIRCTLPYKWQNSVNSARKWD